MVQVTAFEIIETHLFKSYIPGCLCIPLDIVRFARWDLIIELYFERISSGITKSDLLIVGATCGLVMPIADNSFIWIMPSSSLASSLSTNTAVEHNIRSSKNSPKRMVYKQQRESMMNQKQTNWWVWRFCNMLGLDVASGMNQSMLVTWLLYQVPPSSSAHCLLRLVTRVPDGGWLVALTRFNGLIYSCNWNWLLGLHINQLPRLEERTMGYKRKVGISYTAAQVCNGHLGDSINS